MDENIGTDIVSIAILEQDFFAAVENIETICNEASKLGMQVFAVPSRWAGMVAGAPKVPSLFSVQHPQTWMLKKDGTPYTSKYSGVISSVHYPETLAFFKDAIDQLYKLWDIKGLIWDEPKSFKRDYSPLAIENLGADAHEALHYKAVVDFYNTVNQYAKEKYPDKETGLFVYANLASDKLQALAEARHLDYFGCDGRPWYAADGGKQESKGKVLLGESGEQFITMAQQMKAKSLWLIENHNMLTKDALLMDKRLPEIIDKNIDHLIYYYYPRNLEDPDRIMQVIAKHLSNIKK